MFVLLAGLGGVLAARAQTPPQDPTPAPAGNPAYVPMKVIQSDFAVFPNQATALGITQGEARVAVQVDETGKLTDYLVVAYSHPSFAESAVSAIRHWKYQPAILNGNPRGATVELTFLYENRGIVVVDLMVGSYVEMRNLQMRPNAFNYSACHLKDLDRIPTPTKVIRPGYPMEAAKAKESGQVTVTFYIDEEGKVRMPAVSRQANEAFAAAAVEAVSQWQFEPPMSRGRPVLVSARQEFNFKPAP